MLPNANVVQFFDIIFRLRAVFPSCNKTVLEIGYPPTLDTTRIIYGTFSTCSKPLHKLEAHIVQKTDDRPNSGITERHFSDLSETRLYMVHFGLGPFSEIAKTSK